MTTLTMYTFKLKKILSQLTLFVLIFYSNQILAHVTDNEDIQKVNIIRYLITTVGWPNQPPPADHDLNICVLGNFAAYDQLVKMNGTVINHAKINIKNFRKNIKQDDVCQLIYITKSATNNTDEILRLFSKKPILLLSDMNNFAHNGGSMNFISIKDIVGLTINFESLKESHLEMKLSTFQEISVIPEKKDLELPHSK